MKPINTLIFPIIIISTDNNIGNTGAASLSDALKLNKAITKLDLSGAQKKQHKNDIHQQSTLPFLSNKQATALEEEV